MFIATEQRKRRNVLSGPLHPAEIRHLSCFSSEFEKASKVYGALATLAMGDAQAVEIAQTCHVSMALQGGIAEQGNLLTLSGFHPKSSTLVGIIIDDFVSLSIVSRSHPVPSQSSVLSDKMDSQYDAVGLISHKEKGFREETHGSFWGVDIDGEEGLLRGSLKRAIPLVGILIRTAKLGYASVGLLQILAGSIVSLFLFRSRFLAILDYIYRACRGRNDRDIVKLSGRALSELLVAATLIPIAVSNLRAQKKPRVIATDASSWGIGAVMADAPLAFVEELHRYALRNPSSCARCLSMRVGEASNPGPERLGVLLEDTPLVQDSEPAGKSLEAFRFLDQKQVESKSCSTCAFKSPASLHFPQGVWECPVWRRRSSLHLQTPRCLRAEVGFWNATFYEHSVGQCASVGNLAASSAQGSPSS